MKGVLTQLLMKPLPHVILLHLGMHVCMRLTLSVKHAVFKQSVWVNVVAHRNGNEFHDCSCMQTVTSSLYKASNILFPRPRAGCASLM